MPATFDGPASIWTMWRERGDVPIEMLCWHTVLRLRLATDGTFGPLERPAGA